MIAISWNCRGVVNGRVRKHVKELLRSSKADILCLLEIRSPRVEGMGQTDLQVVKHSSQAIHTKVDGGHVTFSYVRPNLLAKSRFWEECKLFSNSIQGPWILMGDLNDIAMVEEQWGSEFINIPGMQRFTDAFSNCGLIDPGSVGTKFTWCRFVGNRVTQMRRIDRVLWNMDAQLAFPEAKVVILPRLHSDHNPILFMDAAGSPPDRNLRPFRFEAAWLNRDDYGLIWKNATNGGDQEIVNILGDITEKSKAWNRDVFGNIFKRKRDLEARIRGIQSNPYYATSRGLQALEKRLAANLNQVLDQEETLWFQKSRANWIKEGDRNTRFYHNSAIIRRNRNIIRFLKINGNWTDDNTTLSNHITSFFASLFDRIGSSGSSNLVRIAESCKISRQQASQLSRSATMEEVRKVAFGMKKFGSPGPDGIPAIFYQHFWEDIGPTLTGLVNRALSTSKVPTSLLRAFITLIPKKDVPETASDFRPITLLNVNFKVVSKVLVNRMRPIMCRLIGPHQNSFLPGRSTLDNVILTQEVIHTMNKKNGKKGLMVFKVDL
ncbi:PREDICTED: uncharacterized protein LOC109159124 [Ipomoea nil]|uniref:uncharacterized protein LOC109159124 n=1 Tax=Ipomoea nil TaxID=35883 RepID=UPI000900DE03|nr:PREDICTED: uncharacterized protein LOC109159124 [Ipomoea nil]